METEKKEKQKRDWDIKRWCREKGLEKLFRRDNLIILVLAGILLFVIAMPSEKKDKDGEAGEIYGAQGADAPSDAEEKGGTADIRMDMSEDEYAEWLEKRLTDTLSVVEGIGEVRVMITLSASRELVVEREKAVSRSATNETDSQGGVRKITQTETGDSVVYSSAGSESEPYVIKTLPPRVEGILVVAEGAGKGTTDRTVTMIAMALFGVEAHKVSVVPMQTK